MWRTSENTDLLRRWVNRAPPRSKVRGGLVFKVEEHQGKVVGQRDRLLVPARRTEEGAELPCAEVGLAEALSASHPAAELVPVLRRVIARVGLQDDVRPDDVGDVPQAKCVALGAVFVGVVATALSRPGAG